MVKTRALVSALALALTFLACLQVSGQTSGGKARMHDPTPQPALRLTFTYSDGRLELVGVQELEMVLPLTVRERVLRSDQRATGYALELRGADARRLLVEEFDDPLRLVSETADPDEPGRIERHETYQESATFSVLVPAPPGARTVVVSRPAPGQEGVAPEQRRREALGAFELPPTKSRGEG